jgi:hypothetical protein
MPGQTGNVSALVNSRFLTLLPGNFCFWLKMATFAGVKETF